MKSVAVRFSATFAANLLRAVLAFASGVIVARGLHASAYGDLYFLLGSFAAVSQLFDLGTSTTFYTFLARRRRSARFVLGYLAVLAGQFAVIALVVGLLLPAGVVGRFWLGHDRTIVLLACAASFLTTQVGEVVTHLGEAVRWTVVVQAAFAVQAVAHLLLLAVAVSTGWLSVSTVLWLLIAEYAVLTVLLVPRLARENVARASDAQADHGVTWQELRAYCQPLMLYITVSAVYAFADRWLLQRFGGSAQQGFFAVAQQFASVTLILTTSLLNVFWKEVAEAKERQDVERLRLLYGTVSRGLFTVGAWFSCLLIPYSHEILQWTVGPGYEAAWLCLSIMLFYPVHQCLGQINGTYLYATGDTRSQTRIGMLVMGLSLPVTYLLLAPPSARLPGFGLAAGGLAMKMVAIQLLGVSLQERVIARTAGLTTSYRYQAAVLGALLALGGICRGIGGALAWIIGLPGHAVIRAVLGSVMYLGCSMVLAVRVRAVAGFTGEDLRRALHPLAKWLPQTALAKPHI